MQEDRSNFLPKEAKDRSVCVKVFLSPLSEHRIRSLQARSSKFQVEAIEKPYGLLIKGRKNDVQRFIEDLRGLEPTGIFIRESAPTVKGHHVFRGFLQLSGEYGLALLISEALRDDRDEAENKVVEAKVIRCRYVHEPLGPVSAAIFKLQNGESWVRCFEGEGRCGWYNCVCCPYGTLIEKRSEGR